MMQPALPAILPKNGMLLVRCVVPPLTLLADAKAVKNGIKISKFAALVLIPLVDPALDRKNGMLI